VVSLLDEAEAAGRVSLNEFHYPACHEACATAAPGKGAKQGAGQGVARPAGAGGGALRVRWSTAQALVGRTRGGFVICDRASPDTPPISAVRGQKAKNRVPPKTDLHFPHRHVIEVFPWFVDRPPDPKS